MRGPDRAVASIGRHNILYKKKSPHFCEDFFKIGIDILSRALDQVPSALVGLTSLFGMGRGDPHRNRRHKGIEMMNDKL